MWPRRPPPPHPTHLNPTSPSIHEVIPFPMEIGRSFNKHLTRTSDRYQRRSTTTHEQSPNQKRPINNELTAYDLEYCPIVHALLLIIVGFSSEVFVKCLFNLSNVHWKNNLTKTYIGNQRNPPDPAQPSPRNIGWDTPASHYAQTK